MSLTKPRVLIVDDQVTVLRMLGLMFEQAGYEVSVAENGNDALKKLAVMPPDLIVLDVMMPGISGLDVCRQVRADARMAHLPIIILSAKSQLEDKVEGFAAGADDYVTKPVARQELIARAQALLHRASQSVVMTPQARVIAFVGAKGGVGTTSLAVNVGTALVQKGLRVTLVELHPAAGTVLYQTNLGTEHDLGQLFALDVAETHWEAEVHRRVTQHPGGLRVLAAPQDQIYHPMGVGQVDAILGVLTAHPGYVLLDLAGMGTPGEREVLARADQVLLVSEPEVLSVRAARAKLRALRDWALLDRVRVVLVSRSASGMQLRREQVEEMLNLFKRAASGPMPAVPLPSATAVIGGSVIALIPPAPEAFQQSSQAGLPVIVIKPDILAARVLHELADWVLQHIPLTPLASA